MMGLQKITNLPIAMVRAGIGGRQSYDDYLKNDNWQNVCEEAFRIASVNLESKPAPAGEMKVVLGPGWPAILIHEAIGHGLEGGF